MSKLALDNIKDLRIQLDWKHIQKENPSAYQEFVDWGNINKKHKHLRFDGIKIGVLTEFLEEYGLDITFSSDGATGQYDARMNVQNKNNWLNILECDNTVELAAVKIITRCFLMIEKEENSRTIEDVWVAIMNGWQGRYPLSYKAYDKYCKVNNIGSPAESSRISLSHFFHQLKQQCLLDESVKSTFKELESRNLNGEEFANLLSGIFNFFENCLVLRNSSIIKNVEPDTETTNTDLDPFIGVALLVTLVGKVIYDSLEEKEQVAINTTLKKAKNWFKKELNEL